MHEVLVNRLGGLSLPWKSVASLTDRPDMTLDVYRGRKTTVQNNNATTLLTFKNINNNVFGPLFISIKISENLWILTKFSYKCDICCHDDAQSMGTLKPLKHIVYHPKRPLIN